MKIKILTVLIVVTVLTIIGFDFFNQNYSITAKTVPTQVPTPTPQINLSDDVLFDLINEWKYKEDGYTYSKSGALCEIANDRVDDQKLDYHKGFIEKYSNYPYVLQENLGTDFTEKAMLSGWLNSPGHREALEHDYKYSCVRCEGDYCVQIFSNL